MKAIPCGVCKEANSSHDLSEVFGEIRGIYFDLDDTLCNYWHAARTGLRLTFEKFPIENYTLEEVMDVWASTYREFCYSIKTTHWYDIYLKCGESTRIEQMRLTLAELGIEDISLAKEMSTYYNQQRMKALELFHDAEQVLGVLSQKFSLGIITNGPLDVQRAEIEKLELHRYVRHVFIEGEFGKGKPHESIFREAQGSMGLASGQILMVGNSFDHDVLPAMRCGWKSIWVSRETDVPPSAGKDAKPFEIPQGLPKPHAIIRDLSELLTLLPA
jgi:putative hydrolase of the HAD superfamily